MIVADAKAGVVTNGKSANNFSETSKTPLLLKSIQMFACSSAPQEYVVFICTVYVCPGYKSTAGNDVVLFT